MGRMLHTQGISHFARGPTMTYLNHYGSVVKNGQHIGASLSDTWKIMFLTSHSTQSPGWYWEIPDANQKVFCPTAPRTR